MKLVTSGTVLNAEKAFIVLKALIQATSTWTTSAPVSPTLRKGNGATWVAIAVLITLRGVVLQAYHVANPRRRIFIIRKLSVPKLK